MEPTTVRSLWLEFDSSKNELEFDFLYGKIKTPKNMSLLFRTGFTEICKI